jgi:hypothetical protein
MRYSGSNNQKPLPGKPTIVFGVIAGLTILTTVYLHAAAPPLPNSTPPPSSDLVTYDAGFSRWLNAPKTVEMSQGVTFSQQDTYLKTSSAIVNLDKDEKALNAKSLAPVHVYDTQNDLTGEQGYIDFTRHLATVTSRVTLVVKPTEKDKQAPTGSARSKFQDPATITCDKFTYDYKHKTGEVPGPLTIHQKDRVLTADSAKYDGGAHTVTLIGNVIGTDSKGNSLRAARIIVGITEGKESITIPVPTHGVFQVNKDEDKQADGTVAPMPVTPPPPTHSATQSGSQDGAPDQTPTDTHQTPPSSPIDSQSPPPHP